MHICIAVCSLTRLWFDGMDREFFKTRFHSDCWNLSENNVEMRQTKLGVLFGVAWKTPKLTSKLSMHDVV